MEIQSGRIYFVREQVDKDALSNMVKIGLVEGDRSPWDRLSEHQTGNPRRLVFDSTQFVETPAVKFVERQLHKLYAKYCVSGEWFKFEDPTLLPQAVSKASELALEMKPLIPLLQLANHLDDVVNDSGKLPYDSALSVYFEPLIVVKKKVSLIEGVLTDIRAFFKDYVAEKGTEDVKDLAVESISYPKAKFNVELFELENPDLFEECKIQATSIKKGGFRLSEKAKFEDLDEDFTEFFTDAQSKYDAAVAIDDLYTLNDLRVELDTAKSLLAWEKELNTAYIKKACGSAEGIEDICSWKRELKSTNEFSEEKLIEKDKTLYATYLVPQEPKKTLKYIGYKA
jgi:hypothetical protein